MGHHVSSVLPPPPPTSSEPDMTLEGALAVLHHLSEAVGWHLYVEGASEEATQLRTQITTAFQTLRLAIHGDPPCGYSALLCDVCYLRYPPIETPLVILSVEAAHGEARRLRGPCVQCLDHLKEAGKLVATINWRTGEETPC